MLAIVLLAFITCAANAEYLMYPVPNPVQSKFIKDQRAMYGCMKRDPTFNLTVVPNYPTCHQEMKGYLQFTPEVDILAATCFGKVYYNGFPLVPGPPQDICHSHHTPLKCPLKKGVLQKASFSVSIPCFGLNLKGRYEVKGECRNADGSMIGCIDYALTWHGSADRHS